MNKDLNNRHNFLFVEEAPSEPIQNELHGVDFGVVITLGDLYYFLLKVGDFESAHRGFEQGCEDRRHSQFSALGLIS